jgi:hypothetical protein
MRTAVRDRALRRTATSEPARAASGRREQFLDVRLGELQRAAVRGIQHRGHQGALAVLQHLHLLLDGAERDQAVHEDVPILTDAVRAVGRLILHRRVPPGIVMDHRVGGGEVQPDPTGLQADQA